MALMDASFGLAVRQVKRFWPIAPSDRLVAGTVEAVAGAMGRGGPALDLFAQVVTSLDILAIQDEASKNCKTAESR